jgi:serine/threonine protein kinase
MSFEAMEPDAARTSFGHYVVESALGAGGMGEVYLATDTRLNRPVALKVLPRATAADAEAHRRMLREARLVATLDHPNVCTIYEIGGDDTHPYIVMQYIQGETLGQRMRRGRFSLAEAVDIARQIASALAEAHKRGIVHRDIKPGNIMLSASGTVKVLDFGLAKSFLRHPDDATEVLISTPGLVAGTTPYMSPEQLLGEPLDGRSDIFSFGTLLYEIATGKRPFDRRTAAGTITAILTEDPEPLGPADLVALEPVISRALAKPVGRRFADASAMHEALTALSEGRTGAIKSSASAKVRRPRRKPAPKVDPAVEKLSLRGRLQWNKRHPEAVRQAIALFQEAVDLDPLHAPSYAGLADAYMMLGFLQVLPPRDVIPKAKAAAQRALELDPDRAEPHASLGYVAGFFEWDWETAERELMTAMRLDPHYAWAPHWYGLLLATKSLDESLTYLTRAHELDPLSPIVHTAIGIAHHFRRDYANALRLYRQVLDAQSTFAPAHYYIGMTYEQTGDYDAAVINFERSAEIAGRGWLFLSALGHCYGLRGEREKAEALLAEIAERERERYVSPYNAMLIHLGLGNIDAALERLQQALADRTASLWNTPVEPRFDRIRNDARFRELVSQYGLEP